MKWNNNKGDIFGKAAEDEESEDGLLDASATAAVTTAVNLGAIQEEDEDEDGDFSEEQEGGGLNGADGTVTFSNNFSEYNRVNRLHDSVLDVDVHPHNRVTMLQDSVLDDDVPQAFSHWTFFYTKRECLVCDLQGVKEKDAFSLTDPAIHCRTGKGPFGPTDYGEQGQALFMRSHECNPLCELLGLTPKKKSL
jgi:hypothetical protein